MGLLKFINWISEVGDRVGDGLKAVGNIAGDAIKGVGNFIVKAVDYGADVVRAVAKNPIPTLLRYAAMAAGSAVGIPPYITSAAITAAQGGKLEDIAVSAAVSYATTSFQSDTQIGADLKNYTTNQWAGDFTDTMMETFDLSADTAVQIAKVASTSLNGALVGGISAAIQGKSVAEGISSGFTTGLVYSSTSSYFDSVNKDPNWGFSPQTLNLMKGATSTALNATISGKKDAAQAVGDYLAYASIEMAGSKLWSATQSTYKNFTEKTKDLQKAGEKYTPLESQYKNKAAESEQLRAAINTDSATYQRTIDTQYTPFKTQYDNLNARRDAEVAEFNIYKARNDEAVANYNLPSKWQSPSGLNRMGYAAAAQLTANQANAAVERINAIDAEMTGLYNSNKPMLDGLTVTANTINSNNAKFNAIKSDIETPRNGNLAQQLQDASKEYQNKYDIYAATKYEADKSAEDYHIALAEVATRNATIDALNTGVITVTEKDEDGNWVLSNNMTLTEDGKFVQDGEQQFTNAAGIDQYLIDLTSADGSKVRFDEDAGRLLSVSDVGNIAERDYGIFLSSEDAEKFAGRAYTEESIPEIIEYAKEKATEAGFTNYNSYRTAELYAKRGEGPSRSSGGYGPDPMQPDGSGGDDSRSGFSPYEGTLAYQQVVNQSTAANAGFPDYKAYQEFGGNLDAYKASIFKPTDTSMDGGEQTAALGKGQVSAIDAGTNPTRYVPIQSVDANNKNAIAASDALSAAVARDGVPKNATFSPVYVTSENAVDANGKPTGKIDYTYYSDVTSSDIDGKPTGYKITYDPVSGQVRYEWSGSSGEKSVDANGNPVLSQVVVTASKTPPSLDATTGQFVDSSGQPIQAPAQTPSEPIPTDAVAEKPDDSTVKNPFGVKDDGTLLSIYGDGTSLVKSDTTGKESIVKTGDGAKVGSKVDLTTDAKTGETTAVVKTGQTTNTTGATTGTTAGTTTGTTTSPSTTTGATTGTTTGTTTGATTGAVTGDTTGATTGAATGTTTGTTTGATTGVPAGTKDLMSQFNSRVDQLVGSGKTAGEATSIASQEIELGLSDIQKAAFQQEKEAASKAAADKLAASNLALKISTNQAAANTSNAAQQKVGMQSGLSLLQPSTSSDAVNTIAPLTASYLTAKQLTGQFESPLAKFLQMQDQPLGYENEYGVQPQGNSMNDTSYSYGTQRPIEDILNMGAPQATDASTQNYTALPYAKGGMAGTRHGKYAQGGLSTPLMASGGKMRVDFRHGDAVTGAGDGQSDDIPAMLADGEFVFPADVVSAIGNGSTKAGSDKLYDMMHGIRAHARSAKPKDLPPQIKSPLDFLKHTA